MEAPLENKGPWPKEYNSARPIAYSIDNTDPDFGVVRVLFFRQEDAAAWVKALQIEDDVDNELKDYE